MTNSSMRYLWRIVNYSSDGVEMNMQVRRKVLKGRQERLAYSPERPEND